MKNKINTKGMEARKIKTGLISRSAIFERGSIDQENRTVELAFSSETDQVERWDGVEILDHGQESVRLGRLTDKAPLLVDHNSSDHVGVIESVQIDSQAGIGRAIVRFGNSARASEILQDIVDGIRSHVSVGYRIYKKMLETVNESGPDIYRVFDWEPYEISILSIPADHSVGVGRTGDDLEFETTIFEQQKTRGITPMDDLTPEQKEEKRKADALTLQNATAEAVRKASEGETVRIREINAMAGQVGERDEDIASVAAEYVRDGKSADQFRELVLERVLKAKPLAQDAPPAALGLNDRELEQYSVMDVVRGLKSGDHSKIGFARELSDEIAARTGKDARGMIVPLDVMARGMFEGMAQRDLSVGTDSAGGHLVGTEHMASMFVELLRNRSMVANLGALVLPGLVGNVDIPTQTGGTAFYWVDEAGGTTESDATFGQVLLTPKTISGRMDVSRRLMMQSAPGIEALLRGDMIAGIGVGIDAAAINGSGASGQPLGILNATGIGDVPGGTNGLAPTWPNVVGLETEVAVDNADMGNLAYLTTAQARGKMKTTEKAANTARFIMEDGEVNGFPAFTSQNVPSNLVKGTSGAICSAAIFGNFADLIIGMWGGVDIKVDETTLGDSGGTVIRVFQDVDVGLRHVESFAATQDLLTA